MSERYIKKSELKNHIRDIPDFPKEGIIFKDITTLLKDKNALKNQPKCTSQPKPLKSASRTAQTFHCVTQNLEKERKQIKNSAIGNLMIG